MMMRETSQLKRNAYIWLFIGGFLLFFINGEYVIPLITWIAPIFIVHFYRVHKNFIGFLCPLIFWIAALFVSFYGMIPLPFGLKLPVLIGIALITFIPFIVDRYLYTKIDGFPSTFILPLSAVSIEYLTSILNPYATWASFAYTQFEHTSLIQIVSITGIWGITFLLFWFYALVNWLWDNNFQHIKKGVILFSITFLLVLLFGEAKLFYSSLTQEETVKIAGITVPNIHLFRDDDLDHLQLKQNVELERTVNEKLKVLQNHLIDLTEREAIAGAKVIFWSEGNGIVLKDNEELFIKKIKEIAIENDTFILMSLATITPGQQAI